MNLLEFSISWHENYSLFARKVDPLILLIDWCMIERGFESNDKVVLALNF